MAGNFLSRALMSLIMDKNAREKYTALQQAKRGGAKKAATAGPPATGPAAPPPADTDDDGDLDILPETLIRRALDEASAELERKKNLPPGRQALIEEALSVHDHQSKLLDDLPKEQREKLVVMAMHAFGADLDEKKKKAAPNKTPAQKTPKKRKPS